MEKPVSFRILPLTKDCSCGAFWERYTHPDYKVNTHICPVCDESPKRFKVRKVVNHQVIDIRFNAKGKVICTLLDAIRLSTELDLAIHQGTFNADAYRYRKNCLLDTTIGKFIENQFLKHQCKKGISPDEREMLEEFMAPYFSEVGTFAASLIHVEDFIRTFNMKGESAAIARRLYSLILESVSQKVA